MVETHRRPERGQRLARQCRRTPIAAGFLDQPGLIEQFIAVEHALFVPLRAVGAEIEPDAVASRQRARGIRFLGLRRPVFKRGENLFLDHRRALVAPVLPRKVAVPRLEGCARHLRLRGAVRRARQRKIADRGDMGVGVAALGMAAAVAECVKLFDIAEAQAGLLLHPRPQADFQRAVSDRVERTERQTFEFVTVAAGGRQDRWFVAVDRHDRRRQSDLDRCKDFIGHRVLITLRPSS